MTKLDSN